MGTSLLVWLVHSATKALNQQPREKLQRPSCSTIILLRLRLSLGRGGGHRCGLYSLIAHRIISCWELTDGTHGEILPKSPVLRWPRPLFKALHNTVVHRRHSNTYRRFPNTIALFFCSHSIHHQCFTCVGWRLLPGNASNQANHQENYTDGKMKKRKHWIELK